MLENDQKLDLAEEFIDKAVQITERRTNVDFYGKTAIIVKIMLKSKMKKCGESDIDDIVDEIKNLDGCLKREYWYISQSYLNLELQEKSEKYLKISQNHLEDISKFIEDEKVRNRFLTTPLLHRKITGRTIEIIPEDIKNNLLDENIAQGVALTFKFCPSCGFDNSKNFKFCPQCGSGLTS